MRPRPATGVVAWVHDTGGAKSWLSVITIGEIYGGFARLRHRGDTRQADWLDRRFDPIEAAFNDRTIPVTLAFARAFSGIGSRQPMTTPDALIAATAIVHGLTVATRNVDDFRCAGVPVVNRFE